jgi:hypothetical protein
MVYPELKTKKSKLPKRVRKVLPSISEKHLFFFDAVCIKDHAFDAIVDEGGKCAVSVGWKAFNGKSIGDVLCLLGTACS